MLELEQSHGAMIGTSAPARVVISGSLGLSGRTRALRAGIAKMEDGLHAPHASSFARSTV